MHKVKSFQKAVAVTALVWVFAIGVPVALWAVSDISLWWLAAGVLLAFFHSLWALIPYITVAATRGKTPTHERIQATQTWDCPLPPSVAVERIIDAFPAKTSITQPEDTSAVLLFGSDVELRRWGIFTNRGRRELPMCMSIRAAPTNGGSRVTVDTRDDLGWYVGPIGKEVIAEAENHNNSLCEVAMKSTLSS